MHLLPEEELGLVPGGTLLTNTPEEGRELAIAMAVAPYAIYSRMRMSFNVAVEYIV